MASLGVTGDFCLWACSCVFLSGTFLVVQPALLPSCSVLFLMPQRASFAPSSRRSAYVNSRDHKAWCQPLSLEALSIRIPASREESGSFHSLFFLNSLNKLYVPWKAEGLKPLELCALGGLSTLVTDWNFVLWGLAL